MVTFKFSSVKKTVARGKRNSYSYTTIISKVEGIIKNVDNVLMVEYNGKLYGIDSESYNTTGKRVIYARKKDEYNHRIKIIRDIDSKPRVNEDHYIPFAEGLIAKGRIIKAPFSNSELFHISSCYCPYTEEIHDDEINYEI